MKDNFTDAEKGKLFALCQDKAMMSALKKVMLWDMYQTGTEKNGDRSMTWAYNIMYHFSGGQQIEKMKSDEQLGQDLRAMVHGLTFLETAMKRLEEFDVKDVPKTPEKNKAL